MANGPTGYEFDAAQNEVIGTLARRMRWVGRFLVALAVVAGIAGVITLGEDPVASIEAIIQGALVLVVAIWTLRASSSFDLVVQTEGSDIPNVMAALGELKKLYTLQYWLIIIAIVLVVVGVIAGLAASPR